MKISECAELFLTYIEDKSPNTVKNYKTDLKQFVQIVGDKDVENISKVDIAKFRMFLQSKKRKSSTIARKLASVNSFFEYLIDMELIRSSPVTKSHRPKISQKVPSSLTDDEIKKVLDNCETLMDKVIILIMLTTGLRSSEVISIKEEDIFIEREGKSFQISSILNEGVKNTDVAFIKVKGKGDKERIVPISGKPLFLLIDYLTAVKRKDEKIFPISYKTLWKRIIKIGEKSGIKLHPHKLRHTAATKALQSGAELRVIQELLGHASPLTTARYAKVSQKQLVETTKRLSNLMEYE
ncbi:MAG: recombinase [Aquificota bacterium]|nr:MAG: recombinase [Aquificota bacterium]